jgi:uncharacterized protein
MSATMQHGQSQHTAECVLAGMVAILDMSGALFLRDSAMLILADMHLEKATSGARRGLFLPPYDSKVTLDLLTQTAAKYAPSRIVFLGDSFHDAHAPLRLTDDSHTALQSLASTSELIWITGNHDPEIPSTIAATCMSELSFAGLHFTHIPQRSAQAPQISGHLHPVAIVNGRGRTLRRRCFASDGTRMILPAFGAFTGGLNIKDKAFDGLFAPKQLISHVIGDQGIYSLPVTAANR